MLLDVVFVFAVLLALHSFPYLRACLLARLQALLYYNPNAHRCCWMLFSSLPPFWRCNHLLAYMLACSLDCMRCFTTIPTHVDVVRCCFHLCRPSGAARKTIFVRGRNRNASEFFPLTFFLFSSVIAIQIGRVDSSVC